MLMQTCKKATELMELREEGRLSRSERLGLWFHVMMCGVCKNYEQQRELLARAIARQLPTPPTEEEVEILKTRVKGALKT